MQHALAMEQSCRQQVASLGGKLAGPGQIGPADVDSLRVAQHNQTDVEQAITSRRDGVPMHIFALLADLENNHVASDDARQRLSTLLTNIDQIERRHLPPAARELLSAVKIAQVAIERQGRAGRLDAALATALAAVGKQQDAVIASLEQMLGQLAKADDDRRFLREMAQLLRRQQQLAQRTAEVGRRTLAQELRDLVPHDRDDLTAAAAEQLELARLVDRVLQEIEQAESDRTQPDAAAAATLADALALAHRLAVGVQMRTVGQQIEANHIGQAAAGQKQIVGDLHDVLDAMAARRRDAGVRGDRASASDAAGRSKSPDAPSTPGAPASESGDIPAKTAGKGGAGDAPGAGSGNKARQLGAEERRVLMARLWGQLPERARQQIVQPPVEVFPPKYEVQIEAYFRRLAEEK